MPKNAEIRFYPLGNADTILVSLVNGQKILVDFADVKNHDDANDRRCDLSHQLKIDLRKSDRNHYDAVCITHLDKDHCKGFGEFFHLEHDPKRQGGDRVKIRELWIPAAAVLEKKENLDDDAVLVQAEAQHRIREGRDVKVFSHPDSLLKWAKQNEVDPSILKKLTVDAGQLVPGFRTGGEAKAELFVHCPFTNKQVEKGDIERNEHAILLTLSVAAGDSTSNIFLGSDADHKLLSTIVGIAERKNNIDRLKWDLLKIPHHCSYLSIGSERGAETTKPEGKVKQLYQEYGESRGVMVSTSNPIPESGSKEDEATDPPHRQAAAYYRQVADAIDGEFIVTMESPTPENPDSFAYEITHQGISPAIPPAGAASAAGSETTRAG